MEKLKMHSPNLTKDNIARIRELFPGCVTEARNEDGKLKLAVDFDQLRQELSESIVEGPQERYHLNWPGKREALLTANAPIAKTLRPCREESVDFDTTKNLFIEGDNLDALKLLQETYLGKVKMIYIDPPYNTGNDFIYEDDFAEDTEEFFKRSNQKDEKRQSPDSEYGGQWTIPLGLAFDDVSTVEAIKKSLKDDGAIFISIDDGEQHNIRRVCDEVFGESNFLANIIWEKVHTRKNSSKYFSISHDHIVAYAKDKPRWDRHLIPRDNTDAYTNPDNDPKGPWKPDPITAHNYYSADYKIKKPNGIVVSRPQDRYWVYSESSWNEKVRNNEVIWGSGDSVPMAKRYLSEVQDGLVPTTIFDRKFAGDSSGAKGELSNLLGLGGIFDYPKPTKLIGRILQITTSNDDIALDFFSGSATTAHAVMQLNSEDGGSRKFIMVQLPEPCDEKSEAFKASYKTIAEISKERIRRAGQKILEGKCHKSWNKDIGFRVLKTDSSNMANVYYVPDTIAQGQLKIFTDNIKSDRKPEDLLFQVLLDWGVDLSLSIRKETIQSKAVFFVNEPPYDLVACFDTGVNEDLVKELARFEPLRVVFRDTGFVSDAVKINVEQIFKQMSPSTEVKSI